MLYVCKNHQSNFLPEAIKKDLAQYKIVFNPSYLSYGGMQYWAFRCYSELRKEILAIIYCYNETSGSLFIHDLNYIFKEKLNVKPADPKLFRVGDKIYCTLNTGYSSKVNNSIFLIQIADDLVIKHCVIAKRNTVEKNWAFFEQGGKLKMLYSIAPMCQVYKLSSVNEAEMFFEEEITVKNDLGSLTIGTQPIVNDDTIYLIAHKKYSFLNKRLYLGVPIKIDMKTWQVKKGSVFLVHSMLSMLGNNHKFNKNLISCSYFSGLQVDFINQKAKLTYGINDVAWQSVQINNDVLW